MHTATLHAADETTTPTTTNVPPAAELVPTRRPLIQEGPRPSAEIVLPTALDSRPDPPSDRPPAVGDSLTITIRLATAEPTTSHTTAPVPNRLPAQAVTPVTSSHTPDDSRHPAGPTARPARGTRGLGQYSNPDRAYQ